MPVPVPLFIEAPRRQVPLPKRLSRHGAWPCPKSRKHAEHRRAYSSQTAAKPRFEARPAVPTPGTWCCLSLPGMAGMAQGQKLIFQDCGFVAGFARSSLLIVAASSSQAKGANFCSFLSAKAHGCSDNCRVILRLERFLVP